MLNQTLAHVVADLDRIGVDYVVIGALALNQHGYKRFTEDIDILVTKKGLAQFVEQLVGLGYRPAFPGARKQFRTSDGNVRIEFVTSGEYPGDGKPKPIVFPDPGTTFEDIEGVRTLPLAKLIELKLASGLTAPDRLKDLADVQELIKVKNLGAEWAGGLDPSVAINIPRTSSGGRKSQEPAARNRAGMILRALGGQVGYPGSHSLLISAAYYPP